MVLSDSQKNLIITALDALDVNVEGGVFTGAHVTQAMNTLARFLNANQQGNEIKVPADGYDSALGQTFVDRAVAFRSDWDYKILNGFVSTGAMGAARDLIKNKPYLPEAIKQDPAKFIWLMKNTEQVAQSLNQAKADGLLSATPVAAAPAQPAAAPAAPSSAVPVAPPEAEIVPVAVTTPFSLETGAPLASAIPQNITSTASGSGSGPVTTTVILPPVEGDDKEKAIVEGASAFVEKTLAELVPGLEKVINQTVADKHLEAKLARAGTVDGTFDVASQKSLQNLMQILRSPHGFGIPGDNMWEYTPEVGAVMQENWQTLTAKITDEKAKEKLKALGENGEHLISQLNILHKNNQLAREQLVANSPIRFNNNGGSFIGGILAWLGNKFPGLIKHLDNFTRPIFGFALSDMMPQKPFDFNSVFGSGTAVAANQQRPPARTSGPATDSRTVSANGPAAPATSTSLPGSSSTTLVASAEDLAKEAAAKQAAAAKETLTHNHLRAVRSSFDYSVNGRPYGSFEEYNGKREFFVTYRNVVNGELLKERLTGPGGGGYDLLRRISDMRSPVNPDFRFYHKLETPQAVADALIKKMSDDLKVAPPSAADLNNRPRLAQVFGGQNQKTDMRIAEINGFKTEIDTIAKAGPTNTLTSVQQLFIENVAMIGASGPISKVATVEKPAPVSTTPEALPTEPAKPVGV